MKHTKMEINEVVSNGLVHFGSFDDPLKRVNLLDSKSPLGYPFPRWINHLRLKEWEAFQVISDQVFILGAIYQTHWMAFNILTVWDLKEGTLQTWQSYGNPFKLQLADQLLNSANQYKAGSFEMCIQNKLESGYCKIEGKEQVGSGTGSSADKGEFQFEFELKSCSDPSVVVMPLGKNRGLYTHKEVFTVQGSLRIGSKICVLSDDAYAIIDDHKGFYPYRMHYDWVTGFEKTNASDWLCFNLTKNQVIDPETHNENRLWVNGKMHRLPIVEFRHLADGLWTIKDQKGLVDLQFAPSKHIRIKKHLLIIDVDYHAPFGFFSGTLTDSEGIKHDIKKACGMGEDKTYRL